jgi:isopenicillin N synthase-like dioxygenase
MARKDFTEHPKFMDASHVANGALRIAATGLGLEENAFDDFEASANRVVDDLTRLLLRAYDAKQSKSA